MSPASTPTRVDRARLLQQSLGRVDEPGERLGVGGVDAGRAADRAGGSIRRLGDIGGQQQVAG